MAGGSYINPTYTSGAPFMGSHRMSGHSCEARNLPLRGQSHDIGDLSTLHEDPAVWMTTYLQSPFTRRLQILLACSHTPGSIRVDRECSIGTSFFERLDRLIKRSWEKWRHRDLRLRQLRNQLTIRQACLLQELLHRRTPKIGAIFK